MEVSFEKVTHFLKVPAHTSLTTLDCRKRKRRHWKSQNWRAVWIFELFKPWLNVLKDQQSRELRRIRTTCRAVYLYDYSTLNKITQFWLVESSTIYPKLYSVGVPIKFLWKRRNFVECTINKKPHDLLVQFVNNRYSWSWKFSNCTRLKARAILRTFKINRTY